MANQSNDQRNAELAAYLARELFKLGSEGPARPCQRIQFMGGNYRDNSEYGMGGLIEPALARCLGEWLRAFDNQTALEKTP